MSLINCMEKIVDEALREFLKVNENIANNLSKEDILDIKIYSLNKLPPCYSTSDKGYVFSKTKTMDSQSKINIITTIVQGIDLVTKNKK